MTTAIEGALAMANRGLPVFRVVPNGKLPYRKGINEATTDAAIIQRWFDKKPDLNYGVATAGYAVLDVDPRKNVDGWLEELTALGDMPKTLTVITPQGGMHIWGSGFEAGQRAISTAIDVRGRGGYVVGPGSVIDGKAYRIHIDAPIAPVPAHVRPFLSRPAEKAADVSTPLGDMDTTGALARAWSIVASHAGVDEGNRDNECFKVACRIKDEGVSPDTCLEVLQQFNAEKCNPPLPDGAIERIASSAYTNGKRPPGSANPEVEFESIVAALVETGLRQSKPAPSATIKATPYVRVAPSAIEPRDWLYGRHLIRKFLSATVAPGGIGKSSLTLVEALSIATGRGLLIGKAPKQGRVWLWNGEDPYDELQRRVEAACAHFGIPAEATAGRLFVDSGRITPIVLATETRNGAMIAEPVVYQVKKTIRENGIDVFVVDPFVASHAVSENDNSKIDAVARKWAEIADECGCAIELVHHVRKTGGAEVTAEDARGASALVAKARSVRTLNVMTQDEADRSGVDSRRSYFRVDSGKQNLAPPSDAATWFELKSVGLGNGRHDRPEDYVGVVAPWSWPSALEGLPDDALARAQRALADGQWRESSQATAWAGRAIIDALGLDFGSHRDKAKVKTLLRMWVADGSLLVVEGKDDKRNVRTFIRPAATP